MIYNMTIVGYKYDENVKTLLEKEKMEQNTIKI